MEHVPWGTRRDAWDVHHGTACPRRMLPDGDSPTVAVPRTLRAACPVARRGTLHGACTGAAAQSYAGARRAPRAAVRPRLAPSPVVPSSLPVIILTALFSLVPALVLFWAWRRGYFRHLDAQSRVIFEPRDLRLARPWEDPVEALTREVAHGPPEAPEPGEWGGADRPLVIPTSRIGGRP